jgi:hypothetical protein
MTVKGRAGVNVIVQYISDRKTSCEGLSLSWEELLSWSLTVMRTCAKTWDYV